MKCLSNIIIATLLKLEIASTITTITAFSSSSYKSSSSSYSRRNERRRKNGKDGEMEGLFFGHDRRANSNTIIFLGTTNRDDENEQTSRRRSSKSNEMEKKDVPSSRRNFFAQTSTALLSLTTTTITVAATTLNPSPSQAACLTGDTSPSCIGYYKLPLDDQISSYVDTPEHLARYAPDLKWVPPVQYPPSYDVAVEELWEWKGRVGSIKGSVLKGDLVGAGMDVLGAVPRITVAGRVVIRSLRDPSSFTMTAASSTDDDDKKKNKKKVNGEKRELTPEEKEKLSMRAYRSEVAHYELLQNLGETDIMIGQSLRGELGSVTMAQIQLLAVLKEADGCFEDLMRAIPTDFSG